ncbi:Alpha/Beta hydrolase protein [Thamnidium elegans]|uniref:Serine aminopeptidase S33 domain-containing protein n=1 Tax=Thamnidium elegans TaxID=101142 RepID=A0A8H7VXZ1_9FUNG|nr:hypothetical protein INT48_005676 [Thamnidium elegans]KAI8088127.1 Alpha/Beta hydrolase protein [Thamnidium elegans]
MIPIIKNNYKVLGLENGPTAALIWLIHGAGGDMFHFETVVPTLTQAGYRVLLNDVRFHGKSQPKPLGEYPFLFDDVKQDMNLILQEVKQQHYANNKIQLFVGGISMGSMISLLYAADKAHQQIWDQDQIDLKGIILLAAGIPYLEVDRNGWDQFRTRQVTKEAFELARSSITVSSITEYGKNHAKRAIDQVSNHALYECLVAIAELLPSPSSAQPIKPYIPLTTVPILLIIPDQDPYTRIEMEELHKINLEHGIQSHLNIIENSGHLVTLDQGLQVGIQTRDFCQSCL